MNNTRFYRGRTEDGKWVYGNLIVMSPSKNGYPEPMAVIMPTATYIAHGDIWGDFWFVDAKTVGMYSTVLDKHSRLIFEGDIVKYKTAYKFIEDDASDAEEVHEHVASVKFSGGRFYPLPDLNICDDYWYSSGMIDFEVIGNIHDNPELLEEKSNG